MGGDGWEGNGKELVRTDYFFYGGVGENAEDGSEYLFGGDFHAVSAVREDRRLDPEAVLIASGNVLWF